MYLCDLTRLVITPQNCDATAVPHLEYTVA
jgi:hypothetical protein